MFGADVGLATTGYAEPNAQWNVLAPLAFWTVALRLPSLGLGASDPAPVVIAGGGLIEGGTRSRAEAQDFFAEEALRALLEILRRP